MLQVCRWFSERMLLILTIGLFKSLLHSYGLGLFILQIHPHTFKGWHTSICPFTRSTNADRQGTLIISHDACPRPVHFRRHLSRLLYRNAKCTIGTMMKLPIYLINLLFGSIAQASPLLGNTTTTSTWHFPDDNGTSMVMGPTFAYRPSNVIEHSTQASPITHCYDSSAGKETVPFQIAHKIVIDFCYSYDSTKDQPLYQEMDHGIRFGIKFNTASEENNGKGCAGKNCAGVLLDALAYCNGHLGDVQGETWHYWPNCGEYRAAVYGHTV